MKIFISYAHQDYGEVKEYVSRLQSEPDINVFWDKNIPISESFVNVVAQQTQEAATLIVFVSINSSNSKFVMREVLFADSNANILIIPLYL